MTTKPKTKLTLICERCGSDNILTDAWARWDYETQAYVLTGTLDDEHCQVCDGETRARFLQDP